MEEKQANHKKKNPKSHDKKMQTIIVITTVNDNQPIIKR